MADTDGVFEALLGHLGKHTDHLDSLHQDVHQLMEYITAPPLIKRSAVDANHALRIDKQDRSHLYILSAVGIDFFYPDLAGQSGNPAQTPFSITPGVLREVPFQTGDELTCPYVPAGSSVIVYLLAQNQVLAV